MEARSRVVVVTMAVLALTGIAWLLLDRDAPPTPTPAESAPAEGAPANAATAPITAEATSATKAEDGPVEERPEPTPRIAAPVTDPKLATLRGRCIDENGSPLADCKVSLMGWECNSQRMDAWLKDHADKPTWTNPAAVTTSADGVFVFLFWPPPPFQFALDLRLEGRGVMSGRWSELAEGTTKDVGDVMLSPGVRVRGRVVDERGTPRDKEYVTLQRQRAGRSRDAMEPRWGEQVVSQADGSFALRDSLAPGEYSIRTEKAELQSPKAVQLTAGRREESLTIVVRVPTPGEAISGRVFDEAGAPVRGIEIEDRSAQGRSSARSGRDGAFKLEQRSPGGAKNAGLRLFSREYEVDDSPREVAWGTQDVEFRVRKAATLTVRVTDEKGAPVDDYLVRMVPHNRGRFSSDDCEPRARGRHDDGTVVIPGLTRGDWLLMVEFSTSSGFGALTQVFSQDGGPKRFDLRAASPLRRTLRVVGPDGPIAGTTVQLCDLFGKPLNDDRLVMQHDHWLMNAGGSHALVLWEGTTNQEGRVELVGPGGRDLGLCVLGPGHVPLRQAPVRLEAAEELVLTVGRGAQFVGTIVPPEALAELKRLAGAEPGKGFPDDYFPRISFSMDRVSFPKDHVTAQNKQDLRVGDDGTFRIGGVPPGTWQVRVDYWFAHASGASGQSIPAGQVTLVDGTTTTHELDLSGVLPGEVEGSVHCNGQLLANGSFFLQGERRGNTVTTDARGRFRTSLLPGDYSAEKHEQTSDRLQWTRIHCPTPVRVTRGQVTSVALTFDSSKVRVTVLDSKGQPATGVQLHMYGGDRDVTSRVTDTHGVAEFEVTTGTTQLRVLPKALASPEAQQRLWAEAQASGNQDPLAPHWIVLKTTTLVTGETTTVEVRLPESSGY